MISGESNHSGNRQQQQHIQILVLGAGLDDSIERQYHHKQFDNEEEKTGKVYAVDFERVIEQRRIHRKQNANIAFP